MSESGWECKKLKCDRVKKDNILSKYKQQLPTTHKQISTMTSLDTQIKALVSSVNDLQFAVKAEVGSDFMAVMRVFLESEGDKWAAEKMGRLEAMVGKIAVNPEKAVKVSGGSKKGVGKTADMSVRCQGCDWKGGKIQNAWCKKGGEHTFKVSGETVKCCAKHFGAWESVSADPHPKMGVGYAVSPSGNGRTGTLFLGFFGVSATNPARRIPLFPGEHYAMQMTPPVGIGALEGEDKPKPSWVDKAMDAASQDPSGKNGRKKGVYMPRGGWEGVAESIKLDKEVYNLAGEEVIPPSPPSSTPPVEDLTEDTEKVDEVGGRKAVDYRDNLLTLTRDIKSGDVYLTDVIVVWLGEEEQVREYKGLLDVANKSCGKYTMTGGIVDIDWHDGAGGPMEEAVSTFIDLADDGGN